MRTLLRFHRYLSLSIAPVMLVMAISGAWQAFRLNDSKRDGSYTAPVVLETISQLHKAEHLKGPAALAFKILLVAIASTFAMTAFAGLLLGLRAPRATTAGWICVILGIVVPVALAYFAVG